jgi:hypothetical protein
MRFARRDLTTNQMVAIGADAIYEDECFIVDFKFYRRYTSINNDNGSTAADSADPQDDRPVRLPCDMILGVFAMPHDRSVYVRRLAPFVAAALSLLLSATVIPPRSRPQRRWHPPSQDASRIVAVVNGDVISNADVDARARLFALSTGLPMAPDVLDRLKPQITRQLVDERLRMQEVQRRKIVVPDKEIAAAIHDIEQRNGLQPGMHCGRSWPRTA